MSSNEESAIECHISGNNANRKPQKLLSFCGSAYILPIYLLHIFFLYLVRYNFIGPRHFFFKDACIQVSPNGRTL